MSALGFVKRASLSVGLYRPARSIHRIIFPSVRRHFLDHKLLLGKFVKPGDLVFDVGANIGNRVEIFLALGARVVAFEPQTSCHRELLARANGNLVVIPKAVGGDEGTAKLYSAGSGDVLASINPDWSNRRVVATEVQMTTLDRSIAEFGVPVFCKIDVEGYETEVLRGLTTAIPTITIEYVCHESGIKKVTDCLGLLGRLADYRVNLIAGENAAFVLSDWLSIDEFLPRFPDCANENFWEDLFVTTRLGSKDINATHPFI